MSDPLFSVIVPAYKAEHLEPCLASVLRQGFPDYELLVVDDCSPQGIKQVVDRFSDTRLHYHRTPRNLGAEDPTQCWNYAFGLSKGAYVVLLGDDDELAPNYLEEMERLIQDHPAATILRARLRATDREGRVSQHGLSLPESKTWDEYLYFRHTYARLHSTSEMTLRADALRKIGGFIPMPGAMGSDDLTWLTLCAEHPIVSTNRTYACWRRHPASLSVQHLGGRFRNVYLSGVYSKLEDFVRQHEPSVISREQLLDLLRQLRESHSESYSMARAKQIARDLMPPLLLRHLRRLRGK